MELAEDVAEEVLDLVPGVDTVGAVQHDHNVHVCGAPCHVLRVSKYLVSYTRPAQLF